MNVVTPLARGPAFLSNHRYRDFHAPGRSASVSMRGMAATSMPAATLTALDVMRSGGNAMDAAIAAVAVLSVIEPQSTGIGGDCFCLYVPAGTGKVYAMNGSGRASSASTPEKLRSLGVNQLVDTSAHVVTIPGAISAWEALNAAHGRKGLDALLQPAIKFAEDGFVVAPRVALDWADARDKLAANEASARHYLKGGQAPQVGDTMRFPALAATLRKIAAQGARGFYEGEVAADMVKHLRALGGLHTEEDFANALRSAEFVEPIKRAWKDMEIYECPPNGTGIITLMILGMLETFTPPGEAISAERLHRHIEAARLAYRDRDAFIADPAFEDVATETLLSNEYLHGMAKLISDKHAMVVPPPPDTLIPKHKDTIYLSVVDEDGNACSFINSLFKSYGSGVMLHNRGFGFRLQEGHPNCIAPGKRPMHTIIPGMAMKDGKALMPFGVMGGHYQPMGQSTLLSNMFDYGMDPQQALDQPRVFPEDGKVQVEAGVPDEVVAKLDALGHSCTRIAKPHGGGQAIFIDHERGVLVGGSDARKDGMALGY
jgi:gamma-glutamyltranspeptidase/glutathione hydrolase